MVEAAPHICDYLAFYLLGTHCHEPVIIKIPGPGHEHGKNGRGDQNLEQRKGPGVFVVKTCFFTKERG
jgi:hypothetical protein